MSIVALNSQCLQVSENRIFLHVSGIIRNSYIRRYEPAWYDAAALRRHRDRVRRDASWPARDQPLILRVRALDK